VIPPIPPLPSGSPATQAATAALSGPGGAGGGGGSTGATDSFASLLGSALDGANAVQQNATTLALQGATGQASVADVTVAATTAQLDMQLVTAVRDKAVQAFNSIMSMST
jgi:flagellar hook-basal body complex protein FliE